MTPFFEPTSGGEMISRKTGWSVVLTASVVGYIVYYMQIDVAYCTSNAGVKYMAHCLVAEWAFHGI